MTEIRVPTLGESVTEATIGRWFKKAGDAVAVDEPLVELETDKVTIEVPAPSAGTLGEIVAKDGETVAVGALLGQINDGAAAAKPAAAPRQGRRRTRQACARTCSRRASRCRCCTGPKDTAGRCAAGAIGAQNFRRERRRCRHRAGLRQGRPRHQGRHARRDRKSGVRADAGQSARRRGAGAGAVAGRRCVARGAREDDAAAPDHRAPPEGSAEHRRHADDLQRGRHEPHHGDARAIQGRVREEARQQARLHGLLHQGLRAGAEGYPRRQRRDRRHRPDLQELLSRRRRGRHRQGPGGAGGARLRQQVDRRDREEPSPISASARATASSRSTRCRAAPSPSPMAASMAR